MRPVKLALQILNGSVLLFHLNNLGGVAVGGSGLGVVRLLVVCRVALMGKLLEVLLLPGKLLV